MKYWGFFCVKAVAAAAAVYYLWIGVARLLPPPRMMYRGRFLGYDLPWTLAAGAVFLIGCGLAFLLYHDQRYRCRVCLRRLRMPVRSGSWGLMLQFGRPRIEYICPYGHGTLKVPELQISGLESPAWMPNDDMWTELHSLEETKR